VPFVVVIKLLKYVLLVPFTGVFAFVQLVLALLDPYLAVLVFNVLAVHPANVYPLQLGFAILHDVLYVAVLSAYVVVFNVQLLFPLVYFTV
jgi:hypothetical protein